MCGICGVAGGDPARGGELVQRMCGSMVHRGPDDEGSIHLDGVTLGMRRLSIIDIEGGHQPMSNEDSTVWVIQNGEIYNHRQLREQLLAAGHRFATKSDTEVLVHGYEEWGERMIERLNGMFAFALLDRRKASLLLARDRMGIKPLHYAIDGERFVFASELKALLQDTALRKGIDPVALDEYLEYEFVPSPRSIVRGVNKLRPGHTLSWSLADRRPAVRRYWAPELNLERAGGPGNLDEECGRLRDALREAVRKELISDVPVGVFLSGGIDSSAVTAMMTQLGGDVKSFSVGFAEPSFDESMHARDVARHLGTDHHELTLEPAALLGLIPKLSLLLDEPLGDASIIPLNQALMIDMRLYLENDILVKLDRASMMASLEGRVPLLNNDFVAYATSLPLHMKLNGLRTKFLLKRALRGILPDRILDRPKKGFGIPVAEWFRGPLKEQMLSALSRDRLAAHGLFEPRAVQQLVEDHLSGRWDNRKQLWTLFAFELWHEGYARIPAV